MKPLIINDKIYGRVKITEPVLIELINSTPMQRLKKINQHGTQSITRKNLDHVNRYEHSLGVMILLKKFNANLPEQIAGLLHDVAHTAFSHVVDHAVGNTLSDNFHEKFTQITIKQSVIPKILKRYDLNFEKLSHTDNLLEKPEPDLCADRLDYFLRDNLVCYKFISKNQLKKILHDLTIINSQWAFTNLTTAELAAKKFIKTAKAGWYHPQNAMGFEILGKIIRAAIDQKLIKEKNLFSDDESLLKQLSRLKQPKIKKQLALLKNFQAKITTKNPDYVAHLKFRAIDPYVLKGSELVRLSKLKPGFKKMFNQLRKDLKEGIPIKIIS